MGGIGSGNRWQTGKATTSQYVNLDVRRLQREGCLRVGWLGSWRWTRDGEDAGHINLRVESGRIVLTYRVRRCGTEWENMSYPVLLDWTGCNFGGRRVWFICPTRDCSRRVAILYGGKVFACRHCHRLAYASQREPDYDRAARRADKIRERLGWEPGILNSNGNKPKGMHWSTYRRLEEQHAVHVRRSLAAIQSLVGEPFDELIDF